MTLRAALAAAAPRDLVLFDCPPTLGLLAVNALTKGEAALQVGVTGLGNGNDNQRQYMLTEAQATSGVSSREIQKPVRSRISTLLLRPATAP